MNTLFCFLSTFLTAGSASAEFALNANPWLLLELNLQSQAHPW
jgi:hypothetical protein